MLPSASIGTMTTEPLCSTISNLVSLPSGVLSVSRLILNVRPCNKGSDLRSSKGMCFSLYEIEFVDYKTKARANSPGFQLIFSLLWNVQSLTRRQCSVYCD